MVYGHRDGDKPSIPRGETKRVLAVMVLTAVVFALFVEAIVVAYEARHA
jgi:hypothetical protein